MINMLGGRSALYGWLSQVHAVLERKELRYPLTPALGRLLVSTSIVCPKWNPDVWQDIVKLEVLSGLYFKDYLLTHVSSSFAVPEAFAENPDILVAAGAESMLRNSDANSVVAPASSGDYPASKNVTVRREGKEKMEVSSSLSPASSADVRRGWGASGFNAPRVNSGADSAAVDKALAAAEEEVEALPMSLVPYPESSESEPCCCC